MPISALLLESRLVKELAPSANRRLRKPAGMHCLRLEETAAGLAVCIEPLEGAGADVEAELYGPFRSERDAKRALEGKAREAGLCLKVMGRERGEGSCFGLQVGKCRGACIGREPRALHDARLRLALVSLRVKPWPFPGPIGIRERGVAGEGSVLHVIDRWRHLGTAASEDEVEDLVARATATDFDPDSYRIIARCLERNALAPSDIDAYALHQGSLYMLQMLAKRCAIPREKLCVNIERYANTVSSSISLLLRDLGDEGRLRPGAKVLVSGFGVGLSWGTNVLTY